eukprot:144011-Pelagomonas_calceolata.AAC.3
MMKGSFRADMIPGRACYFPILAGGLASNGVVVDRCNVSNELHSKAPRSGMNRLSRALVSAKCYAIESKEV